MNEELEKKIKLRCLAIQAANFYHDLFFEQDSDYVDGRKISNIDRALERRIKKISELTGVPAEKIRSIVYNFLCGKWRDYFDELRAIGVPIATKEEVEEYEKR